MLVQLGIVLVVFVSIRQLHGYAERFVDRLLFRERHENERALRDFARHALHFTDVQALFKEAVCVTRSHSAAAWTARYAEEDSRDDFSLRSSDADRLPPEIVSTNDLAVAAMRADRSAVDHIGRSALPDALLLPFIGRGKLTGFLACGAKASGELWAPDERAALSELALSIGLALDGLRVAALESENERLRMLLAGSAADVPSPAAS